MEAADSPPAQSHSLEKSTFSPSVTWDRLLTRKKHRTGIFAQASHLEINLGRGKSAVWRTKAQEASVTFLPSPRQSALLQSSPKTALPGQVASTLQFTFLFIKTQSCQYQVPPKFSSLSFKVSGKHYRRAQILMAGSCIVPCPFDPLMVVGRLNGY